MASKSCKDTSELDEAYVGGRRPGKRGRGAAGKTIVFGMKQRGGRMETEIVPNVRKKTLREATLRTVEPGIHRFD